MYLTSALALLILISSPALTTIIPGTDIDTDYYYRLTTMFKGDGQSLDVVNDATDDKVRLAKTGHFSGQYWRFIPHGDNSYRMTTQWKGTGKSLGVLIDGKDNQLRLQNSQVIVSQEWKITKISGSWYRFTNNWVPGKSIDGPPPILAPTGKFSGQYWKFTKVSKVPTDPIKVPQVKKFDTGYYYRLTTMFKGDGLSLDVVNDANDDKLKLAKTGGFYGQYWRLTEVDGRYYRLTTEWRGVEKSLTAKSDGRNIRLEDSQDIISQHWMLTIIRGQWIRITNRWKPGKAIDGPPPVLAPTGGFSGQHWKFTKLHKVEPKPDPVSTGYHYKLSTEWRGSGFILEVINDDKDNKVQLGKAVLTKNQHWVFIPLGDGYYRITTHMFGPNRSLDVINDGTNNKLKMEHTQDISSQKWRVTVLSDPWVRITNMWQPGKSLDVVNDGAKNQLQLADTGDFSGQRWKISQIHPV